MSSLPAQGVMKLVADAIPPEFHREVIIVGSLAAAYHFFGHQAQGEITTKDVEGMLSPNAAAARSATRIADRLFAAGWTLREDPEWGRPGDSNIAAHKLPILRLHPPGNTEWYLEVAAAPREGAAAPKTFERISTARGDFALYSFRFLALAEEEPLASRYGILYARPEMMALANLLHHPRIGPEKIGKTEDRRANKDLGRALALAWLAVRRDPDALEHWHPRWRAALQRRFPREWRALAARAGDGLRALLDEDRHKLDLDQATRMCNLSLLRGNDLSAAQLRATGNRLLVEALRPLEMASSAA